MSKNKFILSLIILLTASYNHAIIKTYTLLTKGNKQIVILGVMHADQDVNSEQAKIDSQEKTIIFNWLSTLEKSKKSINCIVEGSRWKEEEVSQLMLKNANDYVTTDTSLVLYVVKQNFKSGNIDYVFADCRTKKLAYSLTHQWPNFSALALRNGKFNYENFLENKKEFNKIFGSDVLNDYFKELNSIKQKLKESTSDSKILSLFEQLDLKINNAIKMAAQLNIPMNLSVSDYCSNSDTLVTFEYWQRNFICPIDFLLADIGFIIALYQSLTNLDQIILYCGNAHALFITDFLNQQGFEAPLKLGKRSVDHSNKPDCKFFKLEEIEKLLENTFKDKTQDSETEITQSLNKLQGVTSLDQKTEITGAHQKACARCSKSSCKTRCSNCKAVYYCSTDCQKAHWSIHKVNCTRLHLSGASASAS